MSPIPDFPTWTRANLERFAADAVRRMAEYEEALEQARRDLRDALEALRAARRHDA